jgi:hypothetical protein
MALRIIFTPWRPCCWGSHSARHEDSSAIHLQLIRHRHFLHEWRHFHVILSFCRSSVLTSLSGRLKGEGNNCENCDLCSRKSQSTFRITGRFGTFRRQILPVLCDLCTLLPATSYWHHSGTARWLQRHVCCCIFVTHSAVFLMCGSESNKLHPFRNLRFPQDFSDESGFQGCDAVLVFPDFSGK